MKRTLSSKVVKIVSSLFLTLSVIINTSCFISPFPSENETNGSYIPGGSGNDNKPIYSEYVQNFYIDSLVEGEKGTVYLSLNFETQSNVIPSGNYKIGTDKLYEKWYKNPSRANGVLKDIHNNVCILNGDPRTAGRKGSDFTISVYVPEPSTLTFQFRTDMIYNDCLYLKIDNEEMGKFEHKGYGDGWRKSSFTLSKGTHTIKWYIPQLEGYSENLSNVIYLDNITIAPNTVEFIEIYPKGEQETYIDGTPIKFTALALRGDRTVIPHQNIRYSVTGCGSIDKYGVFTPKIKGKCKLTATVNGTISQSQMIEVHGRDYLSDAVDMFGDRFSADIKRDPNKGDIETNNFILNYPSPNTQSFVADGFFVLKGHTSVPLFIKVEKINSKYETSYFIRNRGDFYKRIWLRFGEGDYKVYIIEDPNMKFFDTKDEKYEGDLIQTGGYITQTFIVTNNHRMSEEEAVWLMPSELVQSDCYLVSNAVKTIKATLGENYTTGDFIRACHNWVIHNLHYDNVSVNHKDRRKRQDAEHVIKYGLAVCEGYANLYASLLRNAGIPCKVIADEVLSHAWNQVYYNGYWYLVDTTFDDPVSSKSDDYKDKNEGSENYSYFMTSQTDSKHPNPGVGMPERSIKIENESGIPDGWY